MQSLLEMRKAGNTEAMLTVALAALGELVAEFDTEQVVTREAPGYGGKLDTGGMVYARLVLQMAKEREATKDFLEASA